MQTYGNQGVGTVCESIRKIMKELEEYFKFVCIYE